MMGARVQRGSIESSATLTNGNTKVVADLGGIGGILSQTHLDGMLERTGLYAYETWHPISPLALTVGVAWEYQKRPVNFLSAPLAETVTNISRVLPKLGLLWEIQPNVTLRSMYSRSVTGVSLEQSYRLEPVQLNGFSQEFRTVIPAAIGGSPSGQDLELGAVALDFKFPTRTYIGLQATFTAADAQAQNGIFFFNTQTNRGNAGQTTEQISFDETAASLSIYQLIADDLAIGFGYEIGRATFESESIQFGSTRRERADVHSIWGRLTYNSSAGFFGSAECRYIRQMSRDWEPVGEMAEHDSDHISFDVQVGWQLPKQRASLTLGVLNILGSDYRLSPLNILPDMPHERVFFVRLRFNLD